MSKKRITLVVFMVLANMMLIGFFFVHEYKQKIANSNASAFTCTPNNSKTKKLTSDEVRECWNERVNRVGVDTAAQEFEIWNKQFDFIQEHVYAHSFGGVLYVQAGKEGLKLCSMNFAYGCFHELIGRAIHAEGIGVVNSLNESCIKNLGTHALGCQHGIGHGIQSTLGYEESDLLKTLSICRGMRYRDPISGCYGGAIMEYTMRTILSLEGGSPRPLTTGKEDICASLDREYQPTCYYQIPQWWFHSLRNKGLFEDQAFAKIGDLCRSAVKGGGERCFRGIGNITTWALAPSVERAVSICKLISDGEHNDFKYCVEDVANSYTVEPELRKEIPSICGVLDGDEVKECEVRVALDAPNVL